MELKANKKKILSVSGHHYTNLIQGIIPVRPEQIWVADLTYLRYQGRFVYLATVEDIFTREIMSAQMSHAHNSGLAFSAIQAAVSSTPHRPDFFHSDQGNEFMAEMITGYLENLGIKISVSDKGSPWQNGYKESFFSRFKG